MGFFHENVLHAHLPSKTYSVEPELNQRPMDIFCSNLILQSTALPTELSTVIEKRKCFCVSVVVIVILTHMILISHQ